MQQAARVKQRTKRAVPLLPFRFSTLTHPRRFKFILSSEREIYATCFYVCDIPIHITDRL